jgi:predicted DNA-binding ribbon-helix-helix protein
MKFAVVKRSVFIDGSYTSVSLKDDFWDGLQEIAADKKISVNKLVERIRRTSKTDNLSSATRLFVFKYFRFKKRSIRKRRKRF